MPAEENAVKPVSYVTFAGNRSIGKGQLLTGVSAAALALVLGMSAAGAQSVTGTGDIYPGLPAPPLANWDLGGAELYVGGAPRAR